MNLRSHTSRYGGLPVPETPYHRAAQVWDDRMGSSLAQARHWRRAAIAMFGLAALLGGCLIWLASQSRITPYVVEVDQLGSTKAIGPVSGTYHPADAQIAYALGQFVENVRSVPLDPVLLRRNWLRAYDHVTSQGGQSLNADAQVRNPFSKVGHETVTVDMISVVRASANSFELRWTEHTAALGGQSVISHYTGIATIVLSTPKDALTLQKNPLGLYVHAFNYTPELTPPDLRPGDQQ
jgi:type IV secretion system protein TrbF